MTTTADTLNLGYRPNSLAMQRQRQHLSEWRDNELADYLRELSNSPHTVFYEGPFGRLKTTIALILLQRRLTTPDIDRAVAAADALSLSALINAAANTDPIRDNR